MSMDAAFGNWLAGFIDGEGSFVVRVVNEPNRRQHYSCNFKLQVRLDDAAIVREVQQRTGLGVVYADKRKRPSAKPNDQPSITWAIQNRKGCADLCELIAKYPLRAKKSRDFAIWREAVRELCGAKDQERLLAYKEALEAIRRYEGRELEELPAPSQLRLIS
jgi:hypothetical protein